MIDKRVKNAWEVLTEISDGMTLMLGGGALRNSGELYRCAGRKWC